MAAGSSNLFHRARACLQAPDPEAKRALTEAAVEDWRAGRLSPASREAPRPIGPPGRPARPRLVPPRQLAPRRLSQPEGRAALLHAVTHIEFNAINLALDAVYRFRDMPGDYYGDWLGVARDEARHFSLLRERLGALGYDYGDFDAHDGLWEMAVATAHDVLARMALVPRVLEARGLDVTPGMMERLRSAGDEASARVLEVILREEVGHVAIGSRWFRYACRLRGVEPRSTFRELLARHMKGRVKGPFHREARLQAGFTDQELNDLQRLEEETSQ